MSSLNENIKNIFKLFELLTISILHIGIKSRKHTHILMDGVNNRPLREDEAGEPLRNYKKVFIQRDYADGMAVRYSTKFPPELEGRVHYRIIFHSFVINFN